MQTGVAAADSAATETGVAAVSEVVELQEQEGQRQPIAPLHEPDMPARGIPSDPTHEVEVQGFLEECQQLPSSGQLEGLQEAVLNADAEEVALEQMLMEYGQQQQPLPAQPEGGFEAAPGVQQEEVAIAPLLAEDVHQPALELQADGVCGLDGAAAGAHEEQAQQSLPSSFWTPVLDQSTGVYYYWNQETNATAWELPTMV